MMNETTRKQLTTRLKKLEGQVAGIRRMVEEDVYCVDILLQMSAAQGALGKAGHLLLSYHVEHCVTDACRHGDEADREQKIAELMDVLSRYGGFSR